MSIARQSFFPGKIDAIWSEDYGDGDRGNQVLQSIDEDEASEAFANVPRCL